MMRTLFILLFLMVLATSCRKIDEHFGGDLTSGQVGSDTSANTAVLLQGVYNSLEGMFTSHLSIFPLAELSTDEAIAPTRGQDWYDNGVWIQLHQQKWNTTNGQITICFNDLNGVVFTATDLLRYHPTLQQAAEAKFIRAWAMFWILDLFDQVPYRDPGESLTQPSRVRKDTSALNYIINQIDSIKNDLPYGPPGVANKYAATALLMKCYLNRAVYANRNSPKFNEADMNKVISLADQIINSNKFSFSADYYDDFAPNNTNIGTENIFTQLNEGGITPNNWLFLAWLMQTYYTQGGYNGFTTLSDFYDQFETADKRRGEAYLTPNSPPNPGHRINIGFLVGQQYDLTNDSPLTDNAGAPLIYTREVHNIDTGSNYQLTGIRPIKYAPDYNNFYSPDNDFVYLRLSDVLLMKAEAILRGGAPTNAGPYGNSALKIVNAIRTDKSRNASSLSSIDLKVLLAERGRELWWECWRRQDMIRFGKFLDTFQEKDDKSDPKYLLYPIPEDQLAVNPNLKQNTGY
jgi:starch-binding outer membrane protein, SusD/RagB family